MALQTAVEESAMRVHPASGRRLPAAARVGRVRLAVLGVEGRLARLGAHGGAEVLLELEELPGVRAIGRRTRLGLYHTAILLPDREALYLTDPDGLTVEVYADRPRSEWRYEGRELVIGTEPLRFAELPQVADDSWKGAPAGTTIGHVHLYVGEMGEASRFYHEALGFDVMSWRYPGAKFLSAGGYHHHLGMNVWAAGSPPASQADARMLFWELVFPTAAERDEAAERMRMAGYRGVETAVDAPCFADDWGIVVALVAAAE
ncbi:MAG TPA: VOC family protein [Edaphobacter sp.]